MTYGFEEHVAQLAFDDEQRNIARVAYDAIRHTEPTKEQDQ